MYTLSIASFFPESGLSQHVADRVFLPLEVHTAAADVLSFTGTSCNMYCYRPPKKTKLAIEKYKRRREDQLLHHGRSFACNKMHKHDEKEEKLLESSTSRLVRTAINANNLRP